MDTPIVASLLDLLTFQVVVQQVVREELAGAKRKFLDSTQSRHKKGGKTYFAL